MKYSKLDIETFGEHLLKTGDLDPVYIALHKMKKHISKEQIYRWLIGYWCLYHCGAASYLSEFEDDDFWIQLLIAAVNKTPTPLDTRWPRGKERRHWRGNTAITSASHLRSIYPKPEELVEDLVLNPKGENALDFQVISKRIQNFYGFGPWIGFKVADMIERLGISKVHFTQGHIFMFKDPEQAAFLAFDLYYNPMGVNSYLDYDKILEYVTQHLEDYYRDFSAPPMFERPVGIQEIETILCKWKSHYKGHYPLNNDINEILHGIEPWRKISKTADLFAESMPTGDFL